MNKKVITSEEFYMSKDVYIKYTEGYSIKEIIEILENRGGKRFCLNTYIYNPNMMYFIHTDGYIRECSKDSIVGDLLRKYYTEIRLPTKKEYTMDEIAKALGIDIKDLKIKK